MNAREIIKSEYKNSKNFITPHVVKVGSIKRGKVAYELSYGDGITRGTFVAGVSIASVVCDARETTKKEHELSRCFVSDESLAEALDAAREYIVELQEV